MTEQRDAPQTGASNPQPHASDLRQPAPAGSRLTDEQLRAFLAEPWICRLATLDAEGFPCVTPLWFEFDGEGYVFIGRERADWLQNIRRDARVGLCIDDPDGSHRRVVVRGRAEIVEGPSVHGPWLPIARRMAARYMGGSDGMRYMERTLEYPRVTVRVVPEQTTTWQGAWAPRYTR